VGVAVSSFCRGGSVIVRGLLSLHPSETATLIIYVRYLYALRVRVRRLLITSTVPPLSADGVRGMLSTVAKVHPALGGLDGF
jgi:hypothetical protein